MNTKNLLSKLMILIATASLLLAACAPAVTPASPADLTDPLTLVTAYYEAVEASDLEKLMTFASEDYVVTDPTGAHIGKEAATAAWQGYFDAGFTFDQSDFKADGNRVTSCYKVYENGNMIDQGCNAVAHVQDGKVVFDGLENAEQIWVIQKYYEAVNAKKLDLAMSFIARDALFINPTGTYEGADAIRTSLEGLNTDGITFDLSNFRNTDGTIIYDYEVLQGGNVLDKGTNGLTVVKDGKIVFDGTEDTAPAAFRPSDPASIAQYFYKAINTGDLEAAMALVADDVQCRGDCYINGIVSFRSFIQGSMNTGLTEITDLQVEGDTVTYNWTGLSKAGFFQASGVETLQIKDGKIILMQSEAN